MSTNVDDLAEMINERRSEGLRHAIEQKKEAEKLVRDEMKALGYDTTTYRYWL